MLPEIGHFALILALSLALLQSTLPLIGVGKQQVALMQVGQSCTLAHWACLTLAFILLDIAFATNDFSVLYVAQNSTAELPFLYRLCAIWGAHEGSLLLWVWLLSCWMLAVALFSRNLPLPFKTTVLSIMGMISAGFLAFLLFTSNPFLRLLPHSPPNGQDLNPLLQDPGFVTHPPLLYLGYVGFSVVFAFAIAALLQREMHWRWVRWVRPWTLIAWAFLTGGITLGSWWSYRQLGWGGWWFWDPVENASFMPWLVGTALIHSLIVSEKRGTFQNWTLLLAIFAFSLSLLGTFLVRSGVLISVHAFAVDPKRGAFMLAYLAIVIGSSLALFGLRHRPQPAPLHSRHFFSREIFILSNNMILTVACATVLLGTLYPLLLQGLTISKISVGAPYFNSVFIPLMILLFSLMGIAPRLSWRELPKAQLFQRLRTTFALAVLLAILLPWVVTHHFHFTASLGMFCALWVAFAVVQASVQQGNYRLRNLWRLSRSHYGMVLGHLGIAVTIIGIVMTVSFQESKMVALAPGDSVTLHHYHFKFIGLTHSQQDNYQSLAANFLISDDKQPIQSLQTEKRIYPVREMSLAKVGIAVNPWRDLYLALGNHLTGNTWSFQIHFKPFVRWIWIGGLLMLAGGLCAASDKRYRKRAKLTSKTV